MSGTLLGRRFRASLALVVGFGLFSFAGLVPGTARSDSALLPIVVVPGKSIAGVRLGDSLSTALRVSGAYRSDGPIGELAPGTQRFLLSRHSEPGFLVVGIRNGRVVALIPNGPLVRTSEGLAVGQPATRITKLYGRLTTFQCGPAVFFVIHGSEASTYIASVRGRVARFYLARPAEEPCHLF